MAKAWDIEPSIFAGMIEEDVGLKIRYIAMQILTAIDIAAPVDTGRFRNNNLVSLQHPDFGISDNVDPNGMNRPGFPGECFICELRLPDHRFRWKHNKLFLLLPEEYGPAFPAIVDCYTSPPTLVWPVPLLHGFSSSYGVLPPLCKDH